METGIYVGAPNMKDAATPIADALVRILESSAEQETIRTALDVFARSVRVENITIQGARVDGRVININDEGSNN